MQHVCHMLLQLYTCDMCKQCGHVQSCQISADMCSHVKLNGRPTTPFGVLASVCVCVCVYARVCARARACVRACVCNCTATYIDRCKQIKSQWTDT